MIPPLFVRVLRRDDMVASMTADDAFSMPRDRLEALVVALSEQVTTQEEMLTTLSGQVTTKSALLATKDERIAALEGEKAELQVAAKTRYTRCSASPMTASGNAAR